jgi:hypothetical protein
MEEHQWLIDEEEGEWAMFECCLQSWHRSGMVWEQINPAPFPDIHCKTCRHFMDEFCAIHQKDIPETFDKRKACKRWNE